MAKPNIAIIAQPSSLNKMVTKSSIATLVDILKPLSNMIFIIAGTSPEHIDEKIEFIKVIKPWDRDRGFILFKILDYLWADLKFAYHLARVTKKVEVVIYYIGAKGFPISVITSRLLRKKVIVFSFNPLPTAAKVVYRGRSVIMDGVVPPSILNILEKATYALSHRIWAESESVINFSRLGKYKNKTSICRTFYINTAYFQMKKKLRERKNLVGYVGRFVEQKGVLNLVKAIPPVLESLADVEFLLGGDGPLFDKVKEEVQEKKLQKKVRLTGWVPEDKLVSYLNDIKLLVLPSYTEGLPRIVQEAMACGAVVLATPVGGIPDLIRDGETGFLLESNSPEAITRGIIKVMRYPKLEDIIRNALNLIQKSYTYEAAVTMCSALLSNLTSSR
jgi:glycosyltransferase involved in cell wall biosynthesis